MSNLQIVMDYTGWTSTYVIGKNIVCLPSLPNKAKTTVEIYKNNWFKFGEALEWQHHLLEHIFYFLETKDLQTVCLVNQFWKKLAMRELHRRISPNWITFSFRPLSNQSLHLYTSKEYTYNHTALGLFVYCPELIKLEQYVWLNKTDNFHKKNMISFAEYIKKEILPKGVDYCTVSCSNIVSNAKHLMETVIYHGLLIPYIPNIRTTMFHCDPYKLQSLDDYINDNEQIKCVLMFCKEQIKFPESFFINLLKKQDPNTVAIGGGLTKFTKIFNKRYSFKNKSRYNRELPNLFCITFLQEEGTEANFNAYSLVVNHNMITFKSRSEIFENELVKLKKSSVLREYGIIFRFRHFVHVTGKEIALVEKHFPNNYQLLGFGLNVDWTVGWTTTNLLVQNEMDKSIQDYIIEDGTKKPCDSKSITHSQSTVLVLLTWGRKINSSFIG